MIDGMKWRSFIVNILIFDTEEKVNKVGASIISNVVVAKPNAVLGLATGGTPVGIYKQLVEANKEGLLSFNDVTTYNLDEYVGIAGEHDQSYRYYMNENLFNHIDIDKQRTHVPNGEAADLELECSRYDAAIEAAGQLDIQLLGLGHNGHIGFNEPDDHQIGGTHVVELAQETRQANARYFASMDEVPSKAITMGVATILKAKTVLLVVKGQDKADIVKQALQGPITTQCPASLLQLHPNLIVLLDQAAGSKL